MGRKSTQLLLDRAPVAGFLSNTSTLPPEPIESLAYTLSPSGLTASSPGALISLPELHNPCGAWTFRQLVCDSVPPAPIVNTSIALLPGAAA